MALQLLASHYLLLPLAPSGVSAMFALQRNALLQSAGDLITAVFGGDTPRGDLELHHVAARAAVVFLFGLAIVRLGKNRLIGRITPLDVLLGFILGSVLSRGITGQASLSGTAVASAVIVALHWALTSLAYRWHSVGNLVKGRATLVVQDGQPLEDNLAAAHLTPHDLEEHLRLAGIEDVGEVQAAYEERSGGVSFLRRRREPRVVEVAVQNGVQTVRVQLE
jgi:uncharacterized membrane protein YcaP (DUF421 family)